MNREVSSQNQKLGLVYTLVVAFCVVLVTIIFLANQVITASANNSDINLVRSTYPNIVGTRIDACALCHTSSIPQLNAYGAAYNARGRGLASSLTGINNIDSDTDGFTNLQELTALTFPGNPADFPAVNTPTRTASPTATRIPPSATPAAPTATRAASTATGVPPTSTAVLPTSTKFPPTVTLLPPASTNLPATATRMASATKKPELSKTPKGLRVTPKVTRTPKTKPTIKPTPSCKVEFDNKFYNFTLDDLYRHLKECDPDEDWDDDDRGDSRFALGRLWSLIKIRRNGN